MRPDLRLLAPPLACVVLACAPAHAQGTLRCPFVRPPGLAAEQVDAVVLQNVVELLQRPPDAIDRTKPFDVVDGTDSASLDYALAARAIGEALGFDATATFAETAQARDGPHADTSAGAMPPSHAGAPHERLSVADMQAAARKAYAAGQDGPPPAAIVGAAYRIEGLAVHTPVPAAGWVILQCGAEHVTFQQGSRASLPLSVATARLTTVPAYTDDAAFEKFLRATVAASLPGLQVERVDVKIAEGSKLPCADVRVAATLQGEAYGLRQRVCYAGRDASFAYLTVFSRLGDAGLAPPAALASAEGFVIGASPK